MTGRYVPPPMPFGLSVSEAARLPNEIPGVATAREVPVPPGHGWWKHAALRRVADLPWVRDHRPSLTLLTFND